MPRNGSGIYSLPAQYLAETGQTIEAVQHNTPLEDMAADLNNARPIVAGGTGESTAVAARQGLGAGFASGTVDKSAGTYSAVKADYNLLWRATGAVTVNLTAAATLTAGWCMTFQADGGDITLDPNGSEQINGSTTLTVTNGKWAFVICTGSAFRAVVVGNGDVTLTGTQTLTNKTLTTPTITLKQSTGPAPTAEGDIQWDTNDDRIVVGDGAGQKTFSDDAKVLLKSGGTMTGKITLDADPSSNLHAATKQYVDGQDFGIGQTWQTVTRSVGTSYQNTTGKAIDVAIEPTGASSSAFEVSPDNSTWLRIGIIIASASDIRQGSWTVPNGYYYRLASGSGGTWKELR